MTTILDGRKVAREMRDEVQQAVATMVAAGARAPALRVVLVGENAASQVYVGMKTKACAEAGIDGATVVLPATASASQVRDTLQALNDDDAVDGILVQLPLPDGLPERELVEGLRPDKDVDGFHPTNIGNLWAGQRAFVPCTPAGILEMLRRYDIELAGRHAVIVGRSLIVGKPMAALLLAENCTVTVCHSRTRDLPAVCRQADLLVAAVGRPAMLGAEHVREGAVVVDVGINRITDAAEVERLFPSDARRRATLERRGQVLVGDVHYTEVAPRASAITPVPGGVGPLTVAHLLVNTLRASRHRQGLDG